jgi:hypothetical protein
MAMATTGQQVRLRATSPLARQWNIAPEAEGTVICCYELLGRAAGAPERLDVRFGPRKVLWGAPAIEFEPIGEPPRQ